MSTSAYWDCETDGVDQASRITCASVIDNEGNVTSFHSSPGSFMSQKVGNKLIKKRFKKSPEKSPEKLLKLSPKKLTKKFCNFFF